MKKGLIPNTDALIGIHATLYGKLPKKRSGIPFVSMKYITNNCTAVVTVGDDGGSSGRLRKELGILPPGDLRNCIVAIADREPWVEKVMEYLL